MSKIDTILSALSGVRKAPPRRGTTRAYRALCPHHQAGGGAHRQPSLSIAETDAGAVLLHCFAGCSVDEITSSISVEMSDLFPDNSSGGRGISGGVSGWASVAALLDAAGDAVANAAAGGDWYAALLAVDNAKAAAKTAMRGERGCAK